MHVDRVEPFAGDLRVYFMENGVQRRQAYSRFAGRSLSEEQQAALHSADGERFLAIPNNSNTEEKKGREGWGG